MRHRLLEVARISSDPVENVGEIAGRNVGNIHAIDGANLFDQMVVALVGVEIEESGVVGNPGPIQLKHSLDEVISEGGVVVDTFGGRELDPDFRSGPWQLVVEPELVEVLAKVLERFGFRSSTA